MRFSFKPADLTLAKFVKSHRLPQEPGTPGLRLMGDADVPAVTSALNQHLTSNYKVHIEFTEDEVRHFLTPRENVVFSYLVLKDDGSVGDFISFYALNSSVLQDPNHDKIFAAYAYYNFVENNDEDRLK